MIVEKLKEADCDIFCFQELIWKECHHFFKQVMCNLGYDFIYIPRSRYHDCNSENKKLVDGCGIFYKRNKLELLQQSNFIIKDLIKNGDFECLFKGFFLLFIKKKVFTIILTFLNKKKRTQ